MLVIPRKTNTAEARQKIRLAIEIRRQVSFNTVLGPFLMRVLN
jgi:hypothetical protein